ncbi:MAG: DUF1295 domain-containing protein [Spirochaetales bacterium]
MSRTEARGSLTVALWITAQAATVALACLLLLSPSLARAARELLPLIPEHEIVTARALLLSAALVILVLRMALTSLVLLPRRIEAAEALVVGVWLAAIHLGMALAAVGNPASVGLPAIAGAVLFLAGSLINTGSELQRKRFRQNPRNKGHLFTAGLFRYSMHINYFGDIVWAIGLSLLTATLWSAAIPIIMTAMFVWVHVPRLDSHLAAKYGAEFEAYRRSTKKLVPWIY